MLLNMCLDVVEHVFGLCGTCCWTLLKMFWDVIEHVYGFSGDRYKNGLHFGKTNDEIIFSSAALGIVQDLNTRK